jgi:ribonucleoside-diphosphate reductase alpha chain
METSQAEIKIEGTEIPSRPEKLDAKVVRFQNYHEKWIAIVGLLNGRPYEIFTGHAEDFWIPNFVQQGWIIKTCPDGLSVRYDFQFEDKQSYKITIEGLSRSFDKQYWNYAKLVSRILRYGIPLSVLVQFISEFNLGTDFLNIWKNGVECALKQFIPDGTKAIKHPCPKCNEIDKMVYRGGRLVCSNCGYVENN